MAVSGDLPDVLNTYSTSSIAFPEKGQWYTMLLNDVK